MNSSNFIRCAMLAGVSLVGAAAMQGQSAPASGALNKVGVVDVRAAIIATAEGKQASAELQSKFAPRQAELENLNKQINDIRQRLQAGANTLSAEEQARLQRQGESIAKQLERKQNEYQQDVNDEQSDVVDRIGRKMVDVLNRYSRENGYAVVLDSSAQNTPLIYKSDGIDITQDIVRLYDQAYPVRAGAAAAGGATKQPAPKPAATQAPPKTTPPPSAKPQ